MKLNILVIFFTTVQTLTGPGLNLLVRRILRVAPANHSLYKLSSNIDIPNHGICAKYCRIKQCLSFTYTVGEKTCETYFRLIEEKLDADIATSTMYFSRVISSCADVPLVNPSGVYPITITKTSSLLVHCDMDTAEGPWTIIHRRTKGDVDFYRKWAAYKKGFGDLQGDFWIGNDNLHLLTNTSRKLRVELQTWDGILGYAEYTNFQVADESQNYKLLVNGFSGNISSDGMGYSDGKSFSTIDRDNNNAPTKSCAVDVRSGWWHGYCVRANLNGLYQKNGGSRTMRWTHFPYYQETLVPLEKARMMIR